MTKAARQGPILRPEPWPRALAGALILLASMAGAFAVILDAGAVRAVGDLHARLQGDETVVVWAHGFESADAAEARAGEILSRLPSVVSVKSLDPSPGDGLVARALGAPITEAAEVRLLAVDLRSRSDGDAKSLVAALQAQSLPARAALHSWRGALGLTGAGLRFAFDLAAPLLALLVVALAAGFEVRRELRANAVAVDLLRRSGAFEADIARMARARVAGLIGVACVWGAAGGLALTALAARAGVGRAFGGLRRVDLASPWPLFLVAAWLVGALAAGGAAKAWLRAGGGT